MCLHRAIEQYTMQKDIDEAMAELYGHHCNLPHEGRGAVGMTLLPAPDTVTFLMSCGGHPGWPCRGTCSLVKTGFLVALLILGVGVLGFI